MTETYAGLFKEKRLLNIYISYLKSVIGDIITILSDGQDTIKREKEANDTSYAHFLEKRNRNRVNQPCEY